MCTATDNPSEILKYRISNATEALDLARQKLRYF